MLDFRSDAGKVQHQGSQSNAGMPGGRIQLSMAMPVLKNLSITGNLSVDDFSRHKERTSYAKDDG